MSLFTPFKLLPQEEVKYVDAFPQALDVTADNPYHKSAGHMA